MKRSKVFLGLTTGILGVVAFAAAKTTKFGRDLPAYYTNAQHICVPANEDFYTGFRTGDQRATFEGSLLYSYNSVSVSHCGKPLYTENL